MVQFNELESGSIGDNVDLVVSKRSDGDYSIAQRVTTEVQGNNVSFFVKHAIQLENLDRLKEVKDIIENAIKKAENKLE